MSADSRVTLAQRALLADFDVHRGPVPISSSSLERLTAYLAETRFPVVYTAFDGDHFALTPLMRRHCLKHGVIPANPESILGYRDTVEKRGTKQGVLRDDLAVLDGCDELWIFTDLPATLEALAALAEGVRVELAFFLSRPSRAAVVKVVPVSELLAGADPLPVTVEITTGVGAVIDSTAEISDFIAGPHIRHGDGLPQVAFAAIDVLDSKYMHWLRPFALGFDKVGLVPGLAVELGDVAAAHGDLGCLLVSWANLLRLADEVWHFPPMEAGRPSGVLPQLLLRVAAMMRPEIQVRTITWEEVQVPKAVLRTEWALTAIEREASRP